MGEATASEVIDALQEIWTEIAAMTDGLSEIEWAMGTDCPGWDVKDLLSHMIGTERSLAGENAPDVELRRRDHLKNEIGVMNEKWVESRRGRSGAEVREEFIAVTTARLETLRSMPAEALEAIGWSPIGQVPMRVFLGVRVMDCWMHDQDARLALGRPGGRDGAGERFALNRADAALGPVIGRIVRPGDGTSVAIEVSGPLGGRRRLEIVEERAVVMDAPNATVTITMEPLTYLFRFGGRITADEVLASPTTIVEGDAALGAAVLDALAVMI